MSDQAAISRSLSMFVLGLLAGAVMATGVFAVALRASQPQASAQGSSNAADGSFQGFRHPSVRLTLSHGLDEAHPVHAGMVRMKEILAERSAGAITVTIHSGGTLGSEPEALELLQRGSLDIAKASAASVEGFIPEYAVYSVPYVFRDADHCWAVLDGDIGRELLELPVARGMRGLCYYDAGARSFYTPARAIMAPADVEDLKVRVMNSPMAMSMVETLGGSPTPLAWGELYTALQQRLVDAAENNPPSFYTSRHYEICREYSLNEHARIPDVLLISEKTWQRLPEPTRRLVLEAAEESSRFQRDLWEQKSDEALVALEQLGVRIHRPDPAPFIEAVRPLHDKLQGSVAELFRRIQAVAPAQAGSPTRSG